jgi:hypothetical protein
MMTPKFDMLKRALLHLSDTLSDLRSELENNPKGNHILSMDIDENINKAEEARNLESPSSHTFLGKYKDIVCCV